MDKFETFKSKIELHYSIQVNYFVVKQEFAKKKFTGHQSNLNINFSCQSHCEPEMVTMQQSFAHSHSVTHLNLLQTLNHCT
jgi:hypothetical protein